jgi:hypothetical protein
VRRVDRKPSVARFQLVLSLASTVCGTRVRAESADPVNDGKESRQDRLLILILDNTWIEPKILANDGPNRL